MQRKGYRIAGLYFLNGPIIDDIESCQDLLNLRWSMQELNSDIRGGVLPIGTIIETPNREFQMVSL